MTEEQAFFAAIDARPDDTTTLLVFADWLAELRDTREAGYRELVRLGKRPYFDQVAQEFGIGREDNDNYIMNGKMVDQYKAAVLPPAWHRKIPLSECPKFGNDWWKYHPSFSHLMDLIARAYHLWKNPAKPKRKRGIKNVLLVRGPSSPNFCFSLYTRPFKTKGPGAGIERRTSGPFSEKLVFVQTDWEYPSLARSLGFSLSGDVPKLLADKTCCPHEATDGTVDCACGVTATDFISAAYDWLADHDGETFECHDYDHLEVEA